ncbi:transposase [Sorangium sp. KYC3313]|uniref:transposase n=1 Tax=Sorangium sp. KYC3313 TaxID=3449740 RepID=UPI003F8B9709
MQPETERLAEVQRRNRPLCRAHLLEETLAGILDGRQANVAREMLVDWTGWAARSQLDSFKKVGRTIKQHLDGPTWNQNSLDWLGREYDRLAARTASFTGALKAGQRSRRAQALSAGSRTTFFRYRRSSPPPKKSTDA